MTHEDVAQLTQDRIADANAHYRALQTLIEMDADDVTVLWTAQIALDHGVKAYISARIGTYSETDNLTELAGRMQELVNRDTEPDSDPMEFQSDIERLMEFSGNRVYGPLTGGENYTVLSNRLTADLRQIYRRIELLTGKNPWEIPTRFRKLQVEPRIRQD